MKTICILLNACLTFCLIFDFIKTISLHYNVKNESEEKRNKEYDKIMLRSTICIVLMFTMGYLIKTFY
ncbi:hypothetical protein [Anaerofustis butyriciformans]|uniref:hypothetical protein n=1 Tax=Anaerofustis butyriciformans TaxID=3108533 RepID=UPI002E337E1B|nr:hypothetical protein [Anaerofustis sp. HA2171]